MYKRPALGVLSSNGSANIEFSQKNVVSKTSSTTTTTTAAGGLSLNTFKSSASNNNLLLDAIQFNNENEPPHLYQSSLQAAAKAKKQTSKQQAADFDFEIFQEETSAKESKQEAQCKYEPEEEEEEEEEEGDENQEDDEQDDEEEEDEEEAFNNRDEDAALEEEGISRLNLAAISESSSLKMINTSSHELMMIMDSSSSTHNDSSSPMVLDDTIKFLSKIEDQDEEEEEEGDEEEDNEDVENDDDEETKRKFEIQERENILMNCLEYKDDILKYMRQLELENRPKVNYMKKQLDITSSMRSILVDWLVEVCDEYKLNVETLYLAVNYTDRFLSQMSVLRGKLQLVGTASMYIASKYEEITPPDVAEFVYITDDTYTKKQVLRMEHLMLKVLDFRMSPPTANWFLSHYLRFIKLQTSLNHANNFDLYQRIDHLSRYLAELTLIDSETFLAYLPSQIAVSAIYLALYTLGRAWTRQIAEICGYSYDLSEIKACINDLFKAMQAAETHPQQAIQEKYKQSRYDYVALTEPPKALPSFLTQ